MGLGVAWFGLCSPAVIILIALYDRLVACLAPWFPQHFSGFVACADCKGVRSRKSGLDQRLEPVVFYRTDFQPEYQGD